MWKCQIALKQRVSVQVLKVQPKLRDDSAGPKRRTVTMKTVRAISRSTRQPNMPDHSRFPKNGCCWESGLLPAQQWKLLEVSEWGCRWTKAMLVALGLLMLHQALMMVRLPFA